MCRGCGRAVDVDCVIGIAPCLKPADAAGFVVDEAEVVFWGLCPDCLPSGGAVIPQGDYGSTSAEELDA